MKSLPTTDIEYLTHHWPVVTGCSFGCPWCWARATAQRFPAVHKYPDGILAAFRKPQCHPDRLDLPLRRKKPARIGVCFTGDLYGPEVPPDFIGRVCAKMALAPQHTFYLLTKRAGALSVLGTGILPDNVWLGVSVTTQAEADERVPLLLTTPAAHRWVSIEPMFGPLDLLKLYKTGNCSSSQALSGTLFGGQKYRGIDWVVVGPIDRPTAQYPAPRREWIDSVVDQCRAARVPVWVKNNAQYLARRDAIRPGMWPQELPSGVEVAG